MFLENSIFISTSCNFFQFMVKLFVKKQKLPCLSFEKRQAGKEIKIGKENL